jgi:catechol 2,3-dioxygenase-like lactoylglutathione lyase family enzyme
MTKFAARAFCAALLAALSLLGSAKASETFVEDKPRFHHLHLLTSDPAAAIAFYTKHFAAKKVQYVDLTDAIWTGDSWLLFTQQATPPKAELTSTLQHFGWGAPDMPREYERQVARGASIHTSLRDISHMVTEQYKPFYFSYINGADGSLIEINTSNNNRFGHIHLASRNPEAAGEWYRKHLGLVRDKNIRSNPRGAVDLLADHVSFMIAGMGMVEKLPEWQGRNDFESTQGHVVDHIAFGVKDLKKTIERLRANGVTIVVEPTRVLSNGKLHTAFIQGPDNALIEIVQDDSPSPGPLP